MMSLVPCESTVRVFYSRFRSRYYSRFQLQLYLTQSQCWEQETLDRQMDSSLYHTLSSSIAFSLGGCFKARSI